MKHTAGTENVLMTVRLLFRSPKVFCLEEKIENIFEQLGAGQFSLRANVTKAEPDPNTKKHERGNNHEYYKFETLLLHVGQSRPTPPPIPARCPFTYHLLCLHNTASGARFA
jgi:hypothetical protein